MSLSNICWFMKHTPKEIDDYVFNDTVQEEEIKKWIEQKNISGNLLLFGPAGCGKTSLAELLINKLINKKQTNVKIIKSRSVNEIDSLYTWVKRKPVQPDQKKIIYIEEFDRLSIHAMNQLKDTLLEKFQEHVSFIVCTNYINKIPHPILTRFTYRYELMSLNEKGTLSRIENILKLENITYDSEDLKEFINKNYKSGLRTIINNIQIGNINNNIDFKTMITENDDGIIENKIIQLAQAIFDITYRINSRTERKLVYDNPINSAIKQEYSELIEIIQFNHNIDWEQIYSALYEKNHFLPLIQVIERYINSLETKKIQHIHFMAFLSEGIETIMKINI
ncbi:MAG: AAA family ATPase [Proteobacteria bacterium]|nr:AAA family ATPase [Pseudomonadota bacterium]